MGGSSYSDVILKKNFWFSSLLIRNLRMKYFCIEDVAFIKYSMIYRINKTSSGKNIIHNSPKIVDDPIKLSIKLAGELKMTEYLNALRNFRSII